MMDCFEEAAKAWLRSTTTTGTISELTLPIIPFSEVKNVEIRRDCDGTQSATVEVDLSDMSKQIISDGGRNIRKAIKDISPYSFLIPRIKKVIFNPPATIVLWKDGTKTVVKCTEEDSFSEWAGLSLCISKKILGDNFHKTFKKWCDKEENGTH